MFNRVLEHEVDRSDGMRLADTIHSSNPLFKPHGIPGNVVVDHHVAELQVQPFSAGVRRNEDASLAGKCFLNPLALVHVHRAVETDDRESALAQEPLKHLLGWNELGEHQHFQFWLAFLGLKAVEPVKKCLRLRIRSGLFNARRPPATA
jgi:hypothetical protein